MNDKNWLSNENKSYGFIKEEDLPIGEFKELNLSSSKIHWAKTSDFSNIAKNHCGAVLITNLYIYFSYKKSKKSFNKTERAKIFSEVHKIVGNGPVPFTYPGINEYFQRHGMNLDSHLSFTYSGILDSLNKQRPLTLLLTKGLYEWHWILGIGYRLYDDGELYIRLVTGWHQSDQYYMKIKYGRQFLSARSYELVERSLD